MPNM